MGPNSHQSSTGHYSPYSSTQPPSNRGVGTPTPPGHTPTDPKNGNNHDQGPNSNPGTY